MSRSRQLQIHIEQLTEICSILDAMKNLALIEVHKLARYQQAQAHMVSNVEQVAADFLSHYPQSFNLTDTSNVLIIIGSERGFCGDFNERLLQDIAPEVQQVIAVGSRLSAHISGATPYRLKTVEGASTTEEVPLIIERLAAYLNNLSPVLTNNSYASLNLSVRYHAKPNGPSVQHQLLPPFTQHAVKTTYLIPPLLNLKPEQFFFELIEYYLLTVLQASLYLSLAAENQRRLQHLEGAVQHLEAEIATLRRKAQTYRQEEITEEIEVLLLNVELR